MEAQEVLEQQALLRGMNLFNRQLLQGYLQCRVGGDASDCMGVHGRNLPQRIVDPPYVQDMLDETRGATVLEHCQRKNLNTNQQGVPVETEKYCHDSMQSSLQETPLCYRMTLWDCSRSQPGDIEHLCRGVLKRSGQLALTGTPSLSVNRSLLNINVTMGNGHLLQGSYQQVELSNTVQPPL
jgi:hypothetical protein